MNASRYIVLAVFLALAACGPRPPADDARVLRAETSQVDVANVEELIPRRLLFGTRERYRGRLSPDGAKLSWLAPMDGVMNIWVAPANSPDKARVITKQKRDIAFYEWALNNTHIIVLKTTDAESFRVASVDVWTGEARELTPGGTEADAHWVASSWDYPDEILIAANGRDPAVFDLYRVNVRTGANKRVFKNTDGFTQFYADNRLKLRVAVKLTPDGGRELYLRDDQDAWSLLETFPPEDAPSSRFVGFDGTNEAIYLIDSRGLNAAGLYHVDLSTGKRELLGAQSGADVVEVLRHPTTFVAEAFATAGLQSEWRALTPQAASTLARLEQLAPGRRMILSRTVDDTRWTVYHDGAENPGSYLIFEPNTGEARELLQAQPELSLRPNAPTTPVVIRARDGLDLIAYLTLPPGADQNGDGRPERTSPLIILPSADAKHQDALGYDPIAQWLSDRGYAVLTLNTRGASGLGKAYRAAGEGELLGGMQTDLVDAVDWAIDAGVADPERVALFGQYTAGVLSLMAMMSPDNPFACTVAVNATVDFSALLADSEAFEAPYILEAGRRLAGDGIENGRIPPPQRPVFLGYDEVGRDNELAAAIAYAQDADPPVIVAGLVGDAFYPATSAGKTGLNAAIEAFYSECLGGALEPIEADILASSLNLRAGAEHAPRLAEILEKRPSK